MITLDRDVCILDVETLGLKRDAPIWEFAALRITFDNNDIDTLPLVVAKEEFLVEHDTSYGTDRLPAEFAADYRHRYEPVFALPQPQAVEKIIAITDGAVIAGSNPAFDIERLALLLDKHGRRPGWHHHPLDIPSMVVGYAAHRRVQLRDLIDGDLHWRSDQLGERVGVNAHSFARHTAAGDVQWCFAQWTAMTRKAGA